MSALDFPNKKLSAAFDCLLGDCDEQLKRSELVRLALEEVAPCLPAVLEAIRPCLSDDAYAGASRDLAIVKLAYVNAEHDAEQVERAIVRLDRAVLCAAANADPSERPAYIF